MRLFIAANLPSAMGEALQDNSADLQAAGVQGTFTQPDNFHLTLAFLGDQGEDALEPLCQALDATAAEHTAPHVELNDYGYFGKAPHCVLWQGLLDPSEVEQLAHTLHGHLADAGITLAAEAGFAAHITLARKVDAQAHPLDSLEEPWVDNGIIDSITLYRSYLSSQGATYEPLHTAHLTRPYEHPEGRLLIIDADACPVTKEALEQARQARVPVLLVGNGTQNLAKHLTKKDPRQPQPGFWAATMNVRGGADSADFQIATVVQSQDVVVTQDFGVAAMALGAGAQALGVRGREYTKAGIDALMLVRHEEKKLRRQGGRTQGPRAFSGEDRQRFSAALQRMLRS